LVFFQVTGADGGTPLAEAEVEEDLKDLRDEMLHLKAHLLAS
jgi:hypothetical protein